MIKNRKVVVVLPAYNAELTLKQTVADIPAGFVDEVILVDDFSKDSTVALAHDLGLIVKKHDKNKGYGANQKTCYDFALERRADIIIMLHPDYQYDPKLIKYFVELLSDDYFDVILGSRIRSRRETLAGGMPAYKYFSNRFLTFIQNLVSGQNLSEWHTGMRAYKKEVLKVVDYHKNSDDFIFDAQMLFKIVENGFSIGEIPVPVRYFPEDSNINFIRSVKYGLLVLKESFLCLARNICKLI